MCSFQTQCQAAKWASCTRRARQAEAEGRGVLAAQGSGFQSRIGYHPTPLVGYLRGMGGSQF